MPTRNKESEDIGYMNSSGPFYSTGFSSLIGSAGSKIQKGFQHMKKKMVIVVVLLVALLIIAYITASLCSVQTADADSLRVLSCKSADGVLAMDIGIGTSSHVLTGYSFSRDTDAVLITVKQAPIWSLFAFKSARLTVEIPIEPGEEGPVYFTDGEKQVAAQLPEERGEP